MSQLAGDTPRRTVPLLPPELTLRIIEESEEAPEHTTVIYTRGDRKEDGTFTRGKLEVLPMQHRCVAGVIQASDTPALPFDPLDDYSVELQNSHFTKRTVVADLGLDENIVEYLLNLDKNALPPYYHPYKLLNFRYAGYAFLDRRFIETIPIVIDGEQVRDLAGITMNQTALTHRLRPDDEKLACEKIKHLMIRCKSFTPSDLSEILKELKSGLVTATDENKWSKWLRGYRLNIMGAALCPKWELLTNLETLCLDMTGTVDKGNSVQLGLQTKKMARHLNLKTLILLGVPCLARYDFQNPNGKEGEESWISYLEDKSTFISDVGVQTLNYLYLFKDVMRPGGQIHFIAKMSPGTAYWPGPYWYFVVPLTEGLQ
ncbi:uncharacterized protein BKA55DRAFT_543369 [Fusarium redolens]|uniref:Uncharacterized protein n=1 Tax=Fusarium redolens TaxID=48865 RepID=A0A9P9GEY3_FUSRE|nr:uncharacterized protein BKA55DRAFT_543369 [Fusarium redolens]KAH7236722.1 hypothetical protein BKA55DRAFT_543369 [Fusarium redolens]